MDFAVVQALTTALGLGLLVGIERERAAPAIAGVRTFTLITVLGTVAALLAREYGGGVLVASAIAVVAFLIVGNLIQLRRDEADPGLTTEVAALVMFGVGAMLATTYRAAAVVLTGTVALLLHWKRPLHRLAEHIGEAEFRAGMRLVLIALVILPIMPDRTYGPYDILNPFQIWLMVVLIFGISLAGYVAYRVFGARRGTLLGGALGGLISSTAATVGYARRAREAPSEGAAAAVVIMVASSVVFVRVLFEIGLVAPAHLGVLGAPVALMLVVMAGLAALAYRSARDGLADGGDRKPQSDLRAAVIFALLYGAVLFAVSAAKERFGTGGLYAVAGISGLTDMDAITLSTAQLVRADRIDPGTGWRVILVAGMANLVFKGAAVLAIGPRSLGTRIAVLFLTAIVAGSLLIAFGPA